MAVHGYLDVADRQHLRGWARDDEDPGQPVSLIVIANGTLLERIVANAFRDDVAAVYGDRGHHGFDLDLTGRLSSLESYRIEILSEMSGEHLNGSPALIESSTAFDASSKAAIAAILAAAETDDEIEDRLAFLSQQMEAMLGLDGRRRQHRREARRKLAWQKGAAAEPMPDGSPRALVIDDRPPDLARDAGSVAIMSHMMSMRRLGYAVSFIPVDLGTDTATLQETGIDCLTRPWYASVEEALARHADAFDLVYLHRATTAANYLPLVRRHQAHARLVFSVADLHGLRMARQAEVEQRQDLADDARHVAAEELAICRRADVVITHSRFEADLLRPRLQDGVVHVVPFGTVSRPSARVFAMRHGVGFIGGYRHSPNIDAALWLVEHVMPHVETMRPGLQCLLFGNQMPQHFHRLATPTIHPVGAVEDLSFVFDRVRLTIAPLAYGAGLKGKVLESFAAGIPCVCTPAAAEGLDLPQALRLLVVSEPVDLARLVVRLHEDEAFNSECANAGQAFVKRHFSEQAIDDALRLATRHEQRAASRRS